MASLIRKLIYNAPYRLAIEGKSALLVNAARNLANYQYMPGPYPKTPEERAAAAKKYGMSLDDYEPYPEDMGYGDYPKLPNISADSKDPYYPYDQPELKRNFNEPMHADSEIMSEDRYDTSYRHRIPLWRQWLWFFGVVGGSYYVYDILEDYKVGRPVVAKQYPWAGEKHYTFDPAH